MKTTRKGDAQTVQVYNEKAASFAASYEAQGRGLFIERICEVFSPPAKIIEFGCGTGADCALMAERGFEVTATDASEAMLQLARARNPKLADRILQATLPEKFPFPDTAFDGAFANSVLQHLTLSELELALCEVHRLLKPNGKFLVWVFDERTDVGSDSRDPHGRLMTPLPPPIFTPISKSAGFELESTRAVEDIFKRSGVKPREYVLRKSAA